jgi:hypothetical protein
LQIAAASVLAVCLSRPWLEPLIWLDSCSDAVGWFREHNSFGCRRRAIMRRLTISPAAPGWSESVIETTRQLLMIGAIFSGTARYKLNSLYDFDIEGISWRPA